MMNITTKLSLLVCMLVSFSLLGMVKEIVPVKEVTISQTRSLFFSNETSWKLLIMYSYEKGKTYGVTLGPHGKELVTIPKSAFSIKVMPSGQTWSKTQVFNPPNLFNISDFISLIGQNADLKVVVSQESARTIIGQCLYPLNFKVSAITHEQILKEMSSLFSQTRDNNGDTTLSGAAAALREQKVPFPRHFLRLPHSDLPLSYPEAIEEAYTNIARCFSFIKDDKRKEKDAQKDMVADTKAKLLEIINDAQDVLSQQHELLKKQTVCALIKQGSCITLEGKIEGIDIEGAYKQEKEKLTALGRTMEDKSDIESMQRCLDLEYAFLEKVKERNLFALSTLRLNLLQQAGLYVMCTTMSYLISISDK